MDQEILIVFFYDVRCAVVNAFLHLECSLLRWQQTAVRTRFVCLHFMNVSNSCPVAIPHQIQETTTI